MPARSTWNDEQINDLLLRYDSGETYNEIARALNRSYAAVQSKIYKLNKDRELYQNTSQSDHPGTNQQDTENVDNLLHGKEEVDTDNDNYNKENIDNSNKQNPDNTEEQKISRKRKKRKRDEISGDDGDDGDEIELIKTPTKSYNVYSSPKHKSTAKKQNLPISSLTFFFTQNEPRSKRRRLTKNMHNTSHEDISNWSVDRVISWIENIISISDLTKQQFREQEIDGKTLKILGKDDLLQLGIKKLYNRIVIIQERDKLI